MKNLVLIRHSKSNWELPLQDFDRPLTARGIRDAGLIASKFSAIIPNDYAIWSSSAKRCTATATIFSNQLNFPLDTVCFSKDLYTFDAHELLQIIKKCKNSDDNLILFGHNEAITNFVNKFGDLYIDNVPTSGLVVLQFDTNAWKTISKGKTITTLFPSQFKK